MYEIDHLIKRLLTIEHDEKKITDPTQLQSYSEEKKDLRKKMVDIKLKQYNNEY